VRIFEGLVPLTREGVHITPVHFEHLEYQMWMICKLFIPNCLRVDSAKRGRGSCKIVHTHARVMRFRVGRQEPAQSRTTGSKTLPVSCHPMAPTWSSQNKHVPVT